MDFYLEALDRQKKKDKENPSVGMILCATKDDEVVEYAMSRTLSPMMVAEYQLQLPDKSILQKKLQELINMPLLKMEKSMVREAEQRDLDAILELYLFLHEDSIPKKDEHLRDTWLQIIQDPNHHLIVNEVDGKIVSSCVCVIIPNLTRNIRPYAFVENVVTREDYRGKGYAGECLEFAREIAEKENCYKMMLLTGSKKPETLRFYEKAGYNSSDKTAFIQWLGMDK
jgi:GNAT superfamily N-acetyltransferase